MRYLVIYDNSGYILMQAQGNVREPVGIPFMYVEVPEGKRLISINTTSETHIPVLEDIPKSEIQTLKEQVDNLNIALAQLMGV